VENSKVSLECIIVRQLSRTIVAFCLSLLLAMGVPVLAERSPVIPPPPPPTELFIAHPPPNYETKAERVFFLGSAPATGDVTINDRRIDRTAAGNFTPVLPLQPGMNVFRMRYGSQEKVFNIKRIVDNPLPERGFESTSLYPPANIARLPGEILCFKARGATGNTASVTIGTEKVILNEQMNSSELTDNLGVFIDRNDPRVLANGGWYGGCITTTAAMNSVKPTYQMESRSAGNNNSANTPSRAAAVGTIQILDPAKLEVAEIKVNSAIARTGPSTDFSRITPLPKGTRAAITGREIINNNGTSVTWLRLDYGGWVNANEVTILNNISPPKTVIRSIRSKEINGATEIFFPLQNAVPISIEQSDRLLSLTLHNTVAQTDIIRIHDDPVISRLDWQQISPERVQYKFNLKNLQQWGYRVRYRGTTLVLTIRHAPPINRQTSNKRLAGIKIVLDPGHGGTELGAVGPNGYKEKDANLYASQLLKKELENKGAIVRMTREDDRFLSLGDRNDFIENAEPHASFSIHYNSLPDGANPAEYQGFSAFWYYPQAHSLAISLTNFTTQAANRPNYGVIWNNLALTRPAIAPATLLELGFMSHPQEIDWIGNPAAQQNMAKVLANGIERWFLAAN
jgi:N-acetylmuramoyl-L-alanine amidase